MSETMSNYFVFLVLPAVFVAIWGYILLYNRSVKKRIQQIENSGRHLTCLEEGISLVTQEKEQAGRTGSIA
ncbi:MAG TPA: hypothetical protein VFS41_02765 [Edaphobacter sp.]|nr:hypothetical protein [Edaphobacter sp.]